MTITITGIPIAYDMLSVDPCATYASILCTYTCTYALIHFILIKYFIADIILYYFIVLL